MSGDRESLFGLNPGEQKKFLDRFQTKGLINEERRDGAQRRTAPAISERFGRFADLPEYKQLQVHRTIASKMGILNPFFACHDGMAKGRTMIGGDEFLNFSTYDYLDLNGHPEINAAALEAMEKFGTSAGASRLVAGERPPHRELEKGLASFYGAEDAVAFVSGHATNVSTLHTLLGSRDAVYHDSLAHNSIILGAVLSGAARYAYPHNDMDALEELLEQSRGKHERVVIATEGLFSMDGGIAKLPELIALKKKYTCFLMVDEAHGLGVLGETGRGIYEHFGVASSEVDIWMGTLSKTLCGCGGFIAGEAALIDLLKFRAPSFVYSVGMPPATAAASAKALELLQKENWRVRRLREISAFFLKEAKARGFNTGHAEGFSIVPIIVGNSLVAGVLASAMHERKINVLPIIYPVVEEGMARLRFFLSAANKEEDIIAALDALLEELPKAEKRIA